MAFQLVFHIHTLLTMYLIVKKRVEVPNQPESVQIDVDDLVEDLEDTSQNLQANATFTSLDTNKKSLASRLRLDASWDKASLSLRVATLLQVIAFLEWFIFSSAVTNPFDLRLGPFINVMVIAGLLIVTYHKNYW